MRARSRPSSSRSATSISRAGGGGYKAIFAEGVTPKPKDLETVGSGEGAAFQQMMKEMPGLAVETAAVGLRKNGGATGHWGPIRRHEAKLFPEADDLLQQVQSLMSAVPRGDIGHPARRARGARACARARARSHDPLWVQQSLNVLGANPPLAEDGISGPLTMAAVAQFQQANGLSPSGVADAATIAAIERRLRTPVRPVPGPSPSAPTDIIALLERLVMLIEKLKAQRPVMDPSSGASQTERLRKTIELLSAILSPGTAANDRSRSARSTARSVTRSASCSTARRPRSVFSARSSRRSCRTCRPAPVSARCSGC